MLFDPEDNPKRSRIAQVLAAPVAPPAMLTPGQSGSYMLPRPMPTLSLRERQIDMPTKPEYDTKGSTLRSILGVAGAGLALAGSPFIGSGLAQGAEKAQKAYDDRYDLGVADYRKALRDLERDNDEIDRAEAIANYNANMRQWEMEQNDRRTALKAQGELAEWDRRHNIQRGQAEEDENKADKNAERDHQFELDKIEARARAMAKYRVGKDDDDDDENDPLAQEDAAILIGNYERDLQQGTSVVDPRTQKRIRRPLTPTESRNYRQDIAKLQTRSKGLSSRDAHRRRVARLHDSGEDWVPAAIEAFKAGALSQGEYDALLKGGAR